MICATELSISYVRPDKIFNNRSRSTRCRGIQEYRVGMVMADSFQLTKIKALGYYLKENIQIALSYITRNADENLLDVLDDICRFAGYSFQANNERNGPKYYYFYS